MSGVSDEDEGPNLLEVEDVAPYLVFSREEQGGYSLCGGAVDALVAYAASPSNQGQNGLCSVTYVAVVMGGRGVMSGLCCGWSYISRLTCAAFPKLWAAVV